MATVHEIGPVLAGQSIKSIGDVRVRRCPNTGKILLRFKVFGKFAPAVFDERRARLVLDDTRMITGTALAVQGEVVRGLVFVFEFRPDDPADIQTIKFSEGLGLYSNVKSVRFLLADGKLDLANPFYRAD